MEGAERKDITGLAAWRKLEAPDIHQHDGRKGAVSDHPQSATKSLSNFNLIAHPDALQIGFVSTTAEGYKQTKQWVNYHRVIGVTHFYLFVDGQAARPEVRSFYSSFMQSSCMTNMNDTGKPAARFERLRARTVM